MPGGNNRDVREVQRCYPQIYLACHSRHRRAPASAHGLSARDSAILSHIDQHEAVTAAALARHLAVQPSTLSAALAKLERLGCVQRGRSARDGRVSEIRLTARGASLMQASSVLDTDRVAALLARLRPAERRRAVDGLGLLARAARAVTREAP
jgi:DNA-binding MarR family transcriptional regulator